MMFICDSMYNKNNNHANAIVILYLADETPEMGNQNVFKMWQLGQYSEIQSHIVHTCMHTYIICITVNFVF